MSWIPSSQANRSGAPISRTTAADRSFSRRNPAASGSGSSVVFGRMAPVVRHAVRLAPRPVADHLDQLVRHEVHGPFEARQHHRVELRIRVEQNRRPLRHYQIDVALEMNRPG